MSLSVDSHLSSAAFQTPRRTAQLAPAASQVISTVMPSNSMGSLRASPSREAATVNVRIVGPARQQSGGQQPSIQRQSSASLPPNGHSAPLKASLSLMAPSVRGGSPARSPCRRKHHAESLVDAPAQDRLQALGHFSGTLARESVQCEILDVVDLKLNTLSKELKMSMHKMVDEIIQEKALSTFKTFEEVARSCQSITLQLEKDLERIRSQLDSELAKVDVCSDAVSELQRENTNIREEFNKLIDNFEEVAASCYDANSTLENRMTEVRTCTDLSIEMQEQFTNLREELRQVKDRMDDTELAAYVDVQSSILALERHQQLCAEDLEIVKNTLNGVKTPDQLSHPGDTGSYSGRESESASGQAGDARAILQALSKMREEITRLGCKLSLEQECREKALSRAEVVCMFEDFKHELSDSSRQRLNAAMPTKVIGHVHVMS